MFKSNYGMEWYIVKLQKPSRILITKLRTLNNRLPVNVGRYQGVNREDRLCTKYDGCCRWWIPFLFYCTDSDIVRLGVMYLQEYSTQRPCYKTLTCKHLHICSFLGGIFFLVRFCSNILCLLVLLFTNHNAVFACQNL